MTTQRARSRGRPPDKMGLIDLISLVVLNLITATGGIDQPPDQPPPVMPVHAGEDVSLSNFYFERLGEMGLARSIAHLGVQVNISGEVAIFNDVVGHITSTFQTLREKEVYLLSKGKLDLIFQDFEIKMSQTRTKLEFACSVLACKARIETPDLSEHTGGNTPYATRAEMPSDLFRDRKERDAFSSVAAVSAVGLSLYSLYELHKLRNRVLGNEQRTNIIVAKLNETLSQVNRNSHHINAIKNGVTRMLSFSKHLAFLSEANLVSSHLSALLDNLSNHVQNVVDIIVHRRVNPSIFAPEKVAFALGQIRGEAAKYNLELPTTNPSALLNFRLSVLPPVRGEGCADVYIHIPLTSPRKLKLYQIVSLPLISENGESQILDEQETILAVSTDHANSVSMRPDELSKCEKYESLFLCNIHITRSRLTSSCIGSIFAESKEGVSTLCRFKPKTLTGEVFYEVHEKRVLVRSPPAIALSVEVDCSDVPNEKGGHFIVHGERIIHVPTGCVLIGPTSRYIGGSGHIITSTIRTATVELDRIKMSIGQEERLTNVSGMSDVEKWDKWDAKDIAPLNDGLGQMEEEGSGYVIIATVVTVLLLLLISAGVAVALVLRSRGLLRRSGGPPTEAEGAAAAWWRSILRPRREETKTTHDNMRRGGAHRRPGDLSPAAASGDGDELGEASFLHDYTGSEDQE